MVLVGGVLGLPDDDRSIRGDTVGVGIIPAEGAEVGHDSAGPAEGAEHIGGFIGLSHDDGAIRGDGLGVG